MEREKYNPEKHCCRYWYKDFCDCITEKMAEIKYDNINGTESMLKKYKVSYRDSNVSNVVVIPTAKGELHLSLIRDNGLFKCRFSNSAKWYKFGRTKLLNLILNK